MGLRHTVTSKLTIGNWKRMFATQVQYNGGVIQSTHQKKIRMVSMTIEPT